MMLISLVLGKQRISDSLLDIGSLFRFVHHFVDALLNLSLTPINLNMSCHMWLVKTMPLSVTMLCGGP
jgi:hypothetical protein